MSPPEDWPRSARQGRALPARPEDEYVTGLTSRPMTTLATDLAPLAAAIKAWGRELGFAAVGIADADLSEAETGLADWLAHGFHGEMDYMARHGPKRARPAELVPGTVRVISARMDYLPAGADPEATLGDSARAYLSRYALGRDYHKVLRGRLQQLADRIAHEIGEFGYRVF